MFMLPKRRYKSLSLVYFIVLLLLKSSFSLFLLCCLVNNILLKTQSFGIIFVIVQLETPEFEKVSTQEERKAFVEKLDAPLWLEGATG